MTIVSLVKGAIATLSGKLKLLDASQLEQVEGRMYALSQKITQISEKKESLESTEKSSKVTRQLSHVSIPCTNRDSCYASVLGSPVLPMCLVFTNTEPKPWKHRIF